MKKLLFLGLFLSMDTLASGWTGLQDIQRVMQRECTPSNKGFEITFAADHKNPDNCPHLRTVNLACDQPGYDTMVSMALTALAANKKIDAWVGSCDTEGHANVSTLVIYQ
ncbi:hypothetical protein MJO52_12005 [Microbulbifer variabilis]|uniref:Uncharacterized protein n=1 Tax=Microbulbifer variabilis TaxID=266805 RepID=A0ABY4V7A2_9GAMM|nr:hypothetical protein [Microbulbifer variabilis]USD19805.1 hypothetical protein MJO52_12005 [Microbulbifer variabilis]